MDGSTSLKIQKKISDKLLFAPATIYICLVFFRFYVTDELFYLLLTSILVIYGTLLSIFLLAKLPNSAFLLFSLMIIFSLCISIIGSNKNFEPTVFFICNFGFAAALLFSREKNRFFLLIIFGFFTWLSIYALIGLDAESFFRVSRNFISIFLLLILSVYYIFCWRDRTQPILLVPLIVFILSTWADGRTGIAVSAVVLLLTFFLSKKSFLKWLLYISISSICLIYFIFFTDIGSFFEKILDRFYRLGVDSVRWDINLNYFNLAVKEIKNILFGVPLEEIDLILVHGLNPHNSLIALHTNYSLAGFSLILLLFLTTLISILLHKHWLLTIVLVGCFIRSFFDISAFYGPLDPIFYSIIILFISYGFSGAYKKILR